VRCDATESVSRRGWPQLRQSRTAQMRWRTVASRPSTPEARAGNFTPELPPPSCARCGVHVCVPSIFSSLIEGALLLWRRSCAQSRVQGRQCVVVCRTLRGSHTWDHLALAVAWGSTQMSHHLRCASGVKASFQLQTAKSVVTLPRRGGDWQML
jgi:hypothetical protein